MECVGEYKKKRDIDIYVSKNVLKIPEIASRAKVENLQDQTSRKSTHSTPAIVEERVSQAQSTTKTHRWVSLPSRQRRSTRKSTSNLDESDFSAF